MPLEVEMKLEMPPIVTLSAGYKQSPQVPFQHAKWPLPFSLCVHASAQSNCCIARVTTLSPTLSLATACGHSNESMQVAHRMSSMSLLTDK